MNGPRAAGRTTASPRRRRAASSASRRRARVATAASEDRLATRRAAFARPPGARRAAGEAIGHRARDHARRPKPPSDAPRKCRRGESGATGARVPAEDAGARTPRREANSPANRDVIVGWTTAGAMVVPAEKRGGARVRLGEARRADGAQFPTGRMPNGADRNGVRADRGGGTPGVRSETRERGDDGARVDREEIERARRPTGVDDGRARQRRRARPIREISQNRTSVRRRAQKSPFNRSSGPPKGAFEPPSARPRALPLAHSPVPLEETRSRQDRAPSAMARASRSPPPHLRPAQNRLVGKASNGKVGGSKTRPDFAHESVVDGRSRLPPQVCR